MSFLIALETHVWVISSHRLLVVKEDASSRSFIHSCCQGFWHKGCSLARLVHGQGCYAELFVPFLRRLSWWHDVWPYTGLKWPPCTPYCHHHPSMMLSADVSCRIFTRIYFSLVMSQRSSRGFPLMHMIWNWRVSLWLVGSLHPKDIPKTWRCLCFLRLVDVKPSVVGCGQRMAGRVRFNCFIRIPFTVLLSLFP